MAQEKHDNVDATQIIRQFLHKQPTYIDPTGQAWLWNDKTLRWDKASDSNLINALREAKLYTDENYFHHQRTKLLTTLKDISTSPKHLPKQPPTYLIQCSDTVYDIRNHNDKGKPATPEYFFPNVIPHKPSKTSLTPTIDKILIDMVGIEYRDMMKEIMVYLLLRDYPIQNFFILYGEGGNGKGEFFKILRKFIGTENSTVANLESLEHDKFSTGDLYGKLLIEMPETNFGKMQDTRMIKSLIGDQISFESKGKNRIIGRATAKVFISSNQLPIASDQTDGFMRRAFIIDCITKFHGKRDIKAISETVPEHEYANLARYAMITLPKLLKRGAFTNSLSVEENRERYNARSNPLPSFINEHCVVNGESCMELSLFKTRLTMWFKEKKRLMIKHTQLINLLAEEGFEVRPHQFRNGIQSSVQGLVLKDLDLIKVKHEEFQDGR